MKRYLKLFSALLAIIGVVMMFFTQVTVKWSSGNTDVLALNALTGGTFKMGTEIIPVSSGLAGYILLGIGGVIILAAALIPYFKEHDILSMVVTGLGVVCIIIGIIFIFMIRKNFFDANGFNDEVTVYVGWAAITAGSLGGVSALAGILGMIMDLAGNN